MNIILLSGGSGKRLWPLSNEVRSKQFLKILGREDGSRESMAQRMYRMIKQVEPDAKIIIATSQSQVPQIKSQLGDNVGICIEPSRRDTFPAVVLAAAYLKKNGVLDNEPVIVCPVDPYVNLDYFECLKKMSKEVETANITLMGITPTYPAEKFGYIIPETKNKVAKVKSFKEKPDQQTAAGYIAQGGLWNGGVFAFKLSYLLNIAALMLGTSDYDALYAKYDEFRKISFDYAVVENEKNINVVRFNGEWKDLGTWNTLTEALTESISGNVTADDCENTHIINELGIPLISLGMKDAVIVATPDGILVTDKNKSPLLKDYVSNQRPMYERHCWGEYKVLDYKVHENNSLVKELVIFPGQHIPYQKHRCRTEIWTFIEGKGELIQNNSMKIVERGDVAIIRPGMAYAVRALEELHIIEVQLGDDLTDDDVEQLDLRWDTTKIQ